jgi:hypothetical protein
MQISLPSHHFAPLQSKYSPQNPFSNNLSLCPSLNVRDQISQPYRTTGKIAVLNLLIFTDSGQEDRRFRTEWQQALPE